MLVLSRKVGEAVIIGGAVVVRVLDVRGRQARLGIEAPPDIPVVRAELKQSDDAKAPGGDESPAAPGA